MQNGAVFLDGDGVLNAESSVIMRQEALRLLPSAGKAVARLNAHGGRVFVFTNQSGVGRGLMTLQDLDDVHARLMEMLQEGAEIAGIYFCPHAPDAGCDSRKPGSGLLLRASEEHCLDLAATS
jgi:histidinol-phosphate phosphatase family protein